MKEGWGRIFSLDFEFEICKVESAGGEWMTWCGENGKILPWPFYLQCSYISFSVLFQTKFSLVWKSYTKKLRTIFQTNSTLVWKKKLISQAAESKPNSVWFGKNNLTEYSVEHCSVGWSWHTFHWTSLQCLVECPTQLICTWIFICSFVPWPS